MPLQFMMLLSLFMGTVLAVSTSSWLLVWMGLEINLMSMITLLTKSKNKSESPMKYFMTQTLASSMLMLGFILLSSHHQWILMFSPHTIIMLSLAMKMAAAPFHFWLPSTMENTSWNNCLILATWQKIAPMMIMLKFSSNLIMMMMIISSAMIGPMGGYCQLSTKKIMAYSSIGHIAWMLSATLINNNIMMIYLTTYIIMSSTFMLFLMLNNISHVSQMINMKNNMMNTMVSLNLLSMGGMPPLLGFFPKWYIIKALLTKTMLPISIMLIISSLFTLFYYLRMTYFSFTMSNQIQQYPTTKMNKTSIMILSPSILGFLMIML